MMNALTTRLATAEDAPALVALVNSAFRGESSKAGWTTEADLLDGQRTDLEAVTEMISAPGHVILVNVPDHVLVACVHLKKTDEDCYLGMLTVLPTAQSSGATPAAMIRWLGGGQRSKVTIGAGISGGKYKWTEFCFDCDNGPVTKSGTVAWGNLEIGGEHQFWSGFSLRYFGGYGHIIAGDLVCDPPATSCGPYYQDDGYYVVYTGIAVGYSF